MKYVYTITSENEILDECFEGIRQYKAVNIAAYYLADRAEKFYDSKHSTSNLANENYFQLISNNIPKVDCMISL